MGWSCLKADNEALDRMMALLRKRMGHVSSSNAFGKDDQYFYEIDTSNEDAIAGVVFKIVGKHLCKTIGKFLIEDGRVRYFPLALLKEIEQVNNA